MEHKPSSQIPVGFLNDFKYQSTPQNGAILLAKLQQKVARLEIALRDKEADLVKLNSSSKASYVNELKIQTEIYYQEVLRLKNQLNRLQETKLQTQIASTNEENERKSPKKHMKDAESQSQNIDKTLLRSVERLKEENENLSTKLSSIQADKERLATEYKNLLLQMKEQDSNKVEFEEGTTQTSPRHESSQPLRKQISDETLNILKVQIEELQSKEKTWEEERATYKELVLSLKEDRIFFKDTSQKRHDELWSLQKELVKLQKDIGGIQLNGKPPCKQCTKPSYRTTKLARKILVKDMGTTTTPRHSISQEGNNSTSPEKSSKSKNSISGSPKRLPTPLKPLEKESSLSSVSKSPSSTTSSGSSSAQPSPNHSSTKKPPKPPTKSSSMRTSSSVEKSQKPEKLSSRTTSGSSFSVDDLHSTSSKRNRAGSLTSPKRIISPTPSSPSKPSTGSLVSPSKRASQISSPLRGKPEIAQQRREKMASSSSASVNSTRRSSGSPAKYLEDKNDEDIASEILKGLDTLDLDDGTTGEHKDNGTTDDHKTNDTGFPSSRSSQTPEEEEEAEPRISSNGGFSQGESGFGDCQEMDHVGISSSEKGSENCVKSLLCLLESHTNRKKKLSELQKKYKQNSTSEMSPASSSKSSSPKKPESKPKLTSSKFRNNSVGKSSPKSTVKFSPKASRSTPKKSPPKLSKEGRKVHENLPIGDGENMKDIDKMISLLEGHIARKAFLSLHAVN